MPETATFAHEPHHDGSPLYRGPVPTAPGGSVRVRVRVPGGAAAVVARVVQDGEPRMLALAEAEGSDGEWWVGDVPLVNRRTNYRFLVRYESGAAVWLTAEGVSRRDVSDRADFVVDASDAAPEWVADQVAYQIFPDRFARSAAAADREVPAWAIPQAWGDPVVAKGRATGQQFYGGDLDGIVEHLDHLADLGVTTLYLTPVFEGTSNHRYDAVSFDRIDPALGGDEAYARLIDAAHERGMRVLGDLTTNHTGSGHHWFRAAQADPGGAEADLYLFGEHPHGYHSWQGHARLPTLNYASGQLRERMYAGEDSIVARWLRLGLDGWRIDVANMTGRQGTTELTHETARGVREAAHRVNPDAWILAEHFHDASGDLRGDGWHGVMDYTGTTFPIWRWLMPEGASSASPLGPPTQPLPASDIVATMREVHSRYPWDAVTSSTLHLDSHDVPRLRTVVGGGPEGIDRGTDDAGLARQRHLLGAALQLTLPGVPALFAGDELGLLGSTGEHSRTPMPWDAPETWDEATLAAYRELIALRRDHAALRRGSLRWLSAGTDHLTYLREHADGDVLVHAVRPHPDATAPRDGAVRLPGAALGAPRELDTLRGVAAAADGDDWLLPGSVGTHIYRLDANGWDWNG